MCIIHKGLSGFRVLSPASIFVGDLIGLKPGIPYEIIHEPLYTKLMKNIQVLILIFLITQTATILAQKCDSIQEYDLRKEFSKSYFEDWNNKQSHTQLLNETFIELEKIILTLQPYPYKNKIYINDHEVVFRMIDEDGSILSDEDIESQCNSICDPPIDITDSLKYIFYDSSIRLLLVDSLNMKWRRCDFKEVIFKPKLKGKILYIDESNRSMFERLKKCMIKDNPNALGRVYDKVFGSGWYMHYKKNAPFNRHMQELISELCLNYYYNDGGITPINPIKQIVFTNDLKEALVSVTQNESKYFYIKINDKWVLNNERYHHIDNGP